MSAVLKLAAVGVGRIGVYHARYIQELARQRGDCVLAAVVDPHRDTAVRVAQQLGAGQNQEIVAFQQVEELIAAGGVDGAVIASRTADHHSDARALIDAGCRVLLEKPLTETLETAREFAAYLNADERRRHSLMQAFMRRFDEPLRHAKSLLDQGIIGTPFKIVSVLEDPVPPPDGYSSAGLLPDMAVHNVDEVRWLVGARAQRVSGTASRLYNQNITTVREDFDDVFLHMWCAEDLVAQIQVSRNHVAGYRNETWIYGQEGLIHVGGFQQDPLKVALEAYSRDGVIDQRVFELRDHGESVPVFIDRFGPAYKAEIAHYIEQCINGQAFAVDHNDGLYALEIVDAGNRSLQTRESGRRVEI